LALDHGRATGYRSTHPRLVFARRDAEPTHVDHEQRGCNTNGDGGVVAVQYGMCPQVGNLSGWIHGLHGVAPQGPMARWLCADGTGGESLRGYRLGNRHGRRRPHLVQYLIGQLPRFLHDVRLAAGQTPVHAAQRGRPLCRRAVRILQRHGDDRPTPVVAQPATQGIHVLLHSQRRDAPTRQRQPAQQLVAACLVTDPPPIAQGGLLGLLDVVHPRRAVVDVQHALARRGRTVDMPSERPFLDRSVPVVLDPRGTHAAVPIDRHEEMTSAIRERLDVQCPDHGDTPSRRDRTRTAASSAPRTSHGTTLTVCRRTGAVGYRNVGVTRWVRLMTRTPCSRRTGRPPPRRSRWRRPRRLTRATRTSASARGLVAWW